jgi:hypothetical protein
MLHSSCDVHDVTSDGKTLHVQSLVRVSHPKRIIDVVDGAGHAPQMILPKSFVMHVSAAVHASELMPGSTPAQHRVGIGRMVLVLADVLKFRLQDHRVWGVQGMLFSTDSMAAVISL